MADNKAPSSQYSVITKPKRRKNATKVWFWSPECKYNVIIERVKEIGWKVVDDEKKEGQVNVYWVDVALIHERFRTVQPWQMVNHFPGMPNVARKNRMGINLNRMLKAFPKEYSFYPRTWVLPGELADFRTNFDGVGNAIGNKIYIIKPDTGCQGRGIYLTKSFDTVPQSENVVAQLYIKKPLLLDGYKFDLRIYVLVTSVKPLRMYLFQDGLVRMCTEQYVKPSKSNIDNVQMHLTNYAVNKNSENFIQPTDAAADDEGDGSKRSLSWFMDYIRDERGDVKADWLWKRMGVLCSRTILSIMPSLSREYDQHFKSFNNVPINIATLQNTTQYQSNASNNNPSSNISNPNPSNEEDEGVVVEDVGEDDVEDKNKVDKSKEKDKNNDEEKNEGLESDEEKDEKGPQFRGSRCFEVLGFDIMIDDNLKPWLIEVNHLPSFGTDSPLDLDIKGRLFEQVFSILPTMPDDEQAYILHHKHEAEKRLMKVKEAAKEPEIIKPKPKRDIIFKKPVPPPEPVVVSPVIIEETPPPSEIIVEEEIKEYIDDGECSPERLDEIKQILTIIYNEYSIQKVSKIDRLLEKYFGREEEFLRFVHHKYNIHPPIQLKKTPPPPEKKPIPIIPPTTSTPPTQIKSGSKENNSIPSLIPKSNKEKRSVRSLSPPEAPRGRSTAAWKGDSEEDELYKQEVLALHMADENDEYMKREVKLLSQFTKIFPLDEPKKSDKEEEKEKEDEEQEEKNDEEQEEVVEEIDVKGDKVEKPAKPSFATYADIMYQAFLLDKRQTMRLRCPLGVRNRNDSETSSLPPLSRFESKDSVKFTKDGPTGLGWRPPPQKKGDKQPTAVREPTQNQLDAAKRLSQGLSVTKTNNIYRSNKQQLLANKVNNLVLDDGENSQLNFPDQYEAQWTNKSKSNFAEDSKLAKFRLDYMRQTPASVLRQQVFRFDGQPEPSSLLGEGSINQVLSDCKQSGPQSIMANHQQNMSTGINVINQVQGIDRNNLTQAQKIQMMANVSKGASNKKSGSKEDQELMLRQLFPGWF
jgi:tubulin polyglutamylase TTLL6/13